MNAPARITALDPDPRRPDAVRVEIDGVRFGAVPRQVVTAENLTVGGELNDQIQERLSAAADVEAKIYHRFVVDYAGEKYIRVIDGVWIWKGIPQICGDTRVVRVSCQIGRIICAPLADRASRQHERRL